MSAVREERKLKKLLALLLALVMIVGLVACGTTAAPETDEPVVEAPET